MNYHGKAAAAFAILSDAQTLPNATSVDSTNMANVGKKSTGQIVVGVYANTAITIATGQAFNIELQCYTSDTAASAASPIDNAHVYLLHKTSADGELAFDAGDLMAEMVLPPNLLEENEYIQLVYTTDADESSEKIDAFCYVQNF